MPEMTVAEMSRLGGLARARCMSKEQRKELARRASLARAVGRVLDYWPELDERQRDRFRRLLQTPEEAGQ